MKRVIRPITSVEFEINIEVISSAFSDILGASSIDFTDTSYERFIESLVAQFKSAGFSKYEDSDYTHDSNFGSLSSYITFTKLVDDIRVTVVVNLRISDHVDRAIRNQTPEQKRSAYVQRISNEIAQEGTSPIPIPLEIIFDDKHFSSYTSAMFYVNHELNEIAKSIAEYKIAKEN